ncbi:FAD-binding protein [Shimia sp.]|uniref:FAD-binding protein n=1 Tax=Shimia sp. TaxID=1954381 RepID=UPI0032994B57
MTNANDNPTPNRRDFLALTGGAVGLASMGLGAAWAQNASEIDVTTISNTDFQSDVLVIGGGMAGLFAAVKAHDAGAETMIVSKGRLGASGLTPFAKGFFTYDPTQEGMSLDTFTETVSRSALGTNNPVYTRQVAEHSFARAQELREWGFFDSVLSNKPFMAPILARDIPLHERIVITHLIKENGKIAGAAGFRLDAEETVTYRAKTVILCTGAGGFKPNGFPVCDLTHDGTIMAYEIGAKVTGKEWNDGHPGNANHPAACFDNWGDMFEQVPGTVGVDVRHDLGVDLNYTAYRNGNPVSMGPPDASKAASGPSAPGGGPNVPEEFQRKGAPGGPPGGGHDRPDGPPPGGEHGGPPPGMSGPNVGGASAGMAIHKSEGLVPIDDRCASTVPGLYAAGDALGSYMAGGIYTQIGSSLAGSAVQGAIAGEAAAEFAEKLAMPEISDARLSEIVDDILAPLKREAGYGPAWVTQTLQGIMIPNFVLYIKKENMMRAALAYIEELRDHHAPSLRAANMHELRLAHETRNMILSAEMKLRASLMRTESRGSHYRLDYPETDDVNWRAWINIHKADDGAMTLAKQPFDAWPNLA